WNYASAPEPALGNRSVWTPRGRVVGGSSSINSMVYMRGHPLDYDAWENDHKLKGWGFADCLPYFKAGEASDRGGDTWRGDSGPLGVSQSRHDSPLMDAFINAGQQAGQGYSDDLNGYAPEGVARLDATRKNGRRCSAAVAHLHPARARPNLTLETGAMVGKLEFSGNRVTGVHYTIGGASRLAHAEAEVILCGGAINSPQLLMLSGIGPADHLRTHGITPRVALSGVGQNLQDHATVILQFASKKAFAMHKAGNPLRKLMTGLRWMIRRDGMAASNIWEAGGLIRGNDKVSRPNLQYHFGPVGFEERDDDLLITQGFAIHIDVLRPTSRGAVTLTSTAPSAKPDILFNYLATPDDMRQMVEGVRKVRELVRQPAFRGLAGDELGVSHGATTDAEITAAIRQISETDYHPCGTCRMGHGNDAVVDGEFKVHGIEGLRVVDASVMPRVISANLNAPTQMMAARAADFILGKDQLAAVHAPFSFQDM
ncbi:MAG: GMC family oxidoreductase N-terminal domain-containing protein, partial [Alphaproteobacteria bacterium]|nr:GMC family oxidoreductase N-terminal domain-containing protein [Alphaproteobacteria bacterium]